MKKVGLVGWRGMVGSVLMERMQAHGWFEGMLFARFAAQQPVVRTLAWPGDEVTVQPRPEKHADMHAQLAEVKADVVLAGYESAVDGAATRPR